MLQRDKFKIKLLSIIIPAYKQEKTIKKDIKKISSILHDLRIRYELIIVVDGIIDKTYQRILQIKTKNIKVLAYKKNEGKGHAIKFGMMHAKGDVIGFIDAGMDIHPTGFKMLLNHMEWYNADVIVGSKLHPVSKVNYPAYRTVLSWGYRLFTTLLFGFKVRDTQVGMKFFKKNVIKKVLPRLVVKQYAFDIELLAIAYAMGYRRIFEAPIEISFKSGSITSKNLWKVISRMLWDTMAVFYRLKILKYYTYGYSKKRKTHIYKNSKIHYIFSK